MDYKRIYDEFIADRRAKEAALIASGKYFERHHIKPRSLGGADDASNMIALTAYDHLIAHYYIAKITRKSKAWFGVKAMLNMRGSTLGRNFTPDDIDPVVYADMRKNMARVASEKAKDQHKKGLGNFAQSPEAKAKRSVTMKSIIQNEPERIERFLKTTQTEIAKQKRSATFVSKYASGEFDHIRDSKRMMFTENNPMNNSESRAKVAAASKEYHNRPEVIEAKRNRVSGDKNPSKRPEVAAKISAACKLRDMSKTSGRNRAVVNLDTGKKFYNVQSAADFCGSRHVSSVCNGTRKTAGGYRWAYAS